MWDRAAITAVLGADADVSGEGTDFSAVQLAENVVLLTFRYRDDGNYRSMPS